MLLNLKLGDFISFPPKIIRSMGGQKQNNKSMTQTHTHVKAIQALLDRVDQYKLFETNTIPIQQSVMEILAIQ